MLVAVLAAVIVALAIAVFGLWKARRSGGEAAPGPVDRVRLPTLAEAKRQHMVHLDDDGNVWVCFIIRPIPARRYSDILEQAAEGKGEDEHVTTNDIAEQVISGGVLALYSSERNTVQELSRDEADAMAHEIWTEWPVWARSDLFEAIKAFSLGGPSPKALTPSVTAGE